MTTYYQIKNLQKLTTEDKFRDGYVPGTNSCQTVDLYFSAPTVHALVEKVLEFFSATKADLEINQFNQVGRIDITVYEDQYSTTASKTQIEQWKRGEIKLWSSLYTGYIEKVEPAKIHLPV